jgi:tape measure domain-containing protein
MVEKKVSIVYELKQVGQKVLSDLGHSMEDASNKAKDLKAKLETLGNVGKTIAIGVGVISASLGALGVASLKLAGEVEQQRTAFKGLLGTYKEADRVIARIRKEASVTPFDTAGLTRMTQQLATITKDGDKAVDILMAVGDAVAMSGKDVVEMERVVLNLQQIASTGKVTAMDIRQFQGAIPIFNDILKASGLTVQKLQDSANASDLLFEAFKRASQQGGIAFGGLAMQSKTLNGTMSTLKDNFDGLLRQLGEGLLPIIQPIVNFLNQILGSFQNLSPAMKTTVAVFVAISFALTSIIALAGGLLALLPMIASGFALVGISMNVAFLGIPAIIAGVVAGITLLTLSMKKMFSTTKQDVKSQMEDISKELDKIQKKREAQEKKIADIQKKGKRVAVVDKTMLNVLLQQEEEIKKKKLAINSEYESELKKEKDEALKIQKEAQIEAEKQVQEAKLEAEKQAQEAKLQLAKDNIKKTADELKKLSSSDEGYEAKLEAYITFLEEKKLLEELNAEEENALRDTQLNLELARQAKKTKAIKEALALRLESSIANAQREEDVSKALGNTMLDHIKQYLIKTLFAEQFATMASISMSIAKNIAKGFAGAPEVLMGLGQLAVPMAVTSYGIGAINAIKLADGGSFVVDQPTMISNGVMAGEQKTPERVDVTPINQQKEQTIVLNVNVGEEKVITKIFKLGQRSRQEGYINDGLRRNF